MPRDPVALVLAAYPVLHHALRQRDVRAVGPGRVSAHQATVLTTHHGFHIETSNHIFQFPSVGPETSHHGFTFNLENSRL